MGVPLNCPARSNESVAIQRLDYRASTHLHNAFGVGDTIALIGASGSQGIIEGMEGDQRGTLFVTVFCQPNMHQGTTGV
jgi:hypothetical protein